MKLLILCALAIVCGCEIRIDKDTPRIVKQPKQAVPAQPSPPTTAKYPEIDRVIQAAARQGRAGWVATFVDPFNEGETEFRPGSLQEVEEFISKSGMFDYDKHHGTVAARVIDAQVAPRYKTYWLGSSCQRPFEMAMVDSEAAAIFTSRAAGYEYNELRLNPKGRAAMALETFMIPAMLALQDHAKEATWPRVGMCLFYGSRDFLKSEAARPEGVAIVVQVKHLNELSASKITKEELLRRSLIWVTSDDCSSFVRTEVSLIATP